MAQRQKGFTLIELLVVIAIIGVLSTVVMTSLNGVRAKARDTRRKSDLEQIALAMEQHFAQYNTYKVAGTGSSGGGQGWFNYQSGSYVLSIGNGLKAEGLFSTVPRDPIITSDNATPQYMLYLCGSGFYTYAKLEAPSARDTATYTSAACRPGYGMNYAVGHSS